MENSRITTILSTQHGMVALDSPIKLKILELLEKGTTSFDELVEKSQKAKSTISVHLQDLAKLNLIQEKTFPNDRRKKYFVLNALYLAYSETPMVDNYCVQLENIAANSLNGNSLKDRLFCHLRYGIEAYGIDPKPILKKLGNDMGIKIGPRFMSNDIDGILNELSIFWEHNKLGNMKIQGNTMVIINCYHCGKMPDVGKTLCSMDEGFIEGVFSSKLKLEYEVQEIECNGTGYHHCKFIMEEK